jgi:MoaA/NifB/PqqE/SkfB family radical SAM enzyme
MDNAKYIDKYLSPTRKAAQNIPKVVSVEVTTRCQLNCVYCTRDKNQPQDLSLEKLQFIQKQLPGVKRMIFCGLGESFCYPEIYRALETLRDFTVSIITNGSVPIDFPRLTTVGNVILLVFSIDATTPEKMAEICGGYNFQVLLRNLVNLWKYPSITRIINATINQYNVDEIVNLVRFAAKYRMQAVNFELPIGQYQFVEENRLLIHGQIKEAVKAAAECGIIFNPFFKLPCISADSILPIIRLNGDMFPCCYGMYAGKVIGNIYQQNIQEIWNNGVSSLLNETVCYQCEQVKNLLAVTME